MKSELGSLNSLCCNWNLKRPQQEMNLNWLASWSRWDNWLSSCFIMVSGSDWYSTGSQKGWLYGSTIWRLSSQNGLSTIFDIFKVRELSYRPNTNNAFLMILSSLCIKVYISEVMLKSITNFLIIFFIFQQLKSQISQIDQNGYNPFCH